MDAETVFDFNLKILAMGISSSVINPLEMKQRQGYHLTAIPFIIKSNP
jgi:hypothetical protein